MQLLFWQFFFIVAFVSVSAQGGATGPSIMTLSSDKVTGSFLNRDRTRRLVEYDVVPGPKVHCDVQVDQIDQHHAPTGYKGWHLVFTFTHPKLDADEKTEKLDFFWNAAASPSPFSEGFKEKYQYLDAFSDLPFSYTAQFDKAENALIVESPYFGGFTVSTYKFHLSADKKEVDFFEFESKAFGSVTKSIRCEGPAILDLK